MATVASLTICSTCCSRSDPPVTFCPPCSRALEAEIESYWLPLINTAKHDLALLISEQEKFESTYWLSQKALSDKQCELENKGLRGDLWQTICTELMERVWIHGDIKMEMAGKRLDLEEELQLHRSGFARELWTFKQSRDGKEEFLF